MKCAATKYWMSWWEMVLHGLTNNHQRLHTGSHHSFPYRLGKNKLFILREYFPNLGPGHENLTEYTINYVLACTLLCLNTTPKEMMEHKMKDRKRDDSKHFFSIRPDKENTKPNERENFITKRDWRMGWRKKFFCFCFFFFDQVKKEKTGDLCVSMECGAQKDKQYINPKFYFWWRWQIIIIIRLNLNVSW